ncbi:MAG: 50S ribosomal protein L28 [Tissierellia bacterium]|nr:50S ribosomal protein L28 [Tissierellia bacterium]
MAKICEICGKTKSFGNKVTFSNKRSSRTWAPNIRRVKADVNGTVKRINVCTRCLRSGYVKRAI